MACPYDALIHRGAIAPYAFRYDATSADVANFDLSTVTSAVFQVRRENGHVETWLATLSLATTTTLRITHVFAAGDVDRLETLTITPVMTAPSGDFYAKSRRLQVREAADL